MDLEGTDFSFDPVDPWATALILVTLLGAAVLLWRLDNRVIRMPERDFSVATVLFGVLNAYVFAALAGYSMATVFQVGGIAKIAPTVDYDADSIIDWVVVTQGVVGQWVFMLGFLIVPPLVAAAVVVARAHFSRRKTARLLTMAGALIGAAAWYWFLELAAAGHQDWCAVRPTHLQAAGGRAMQLLVTLVGCSLGGLTLARTLGRPRLAP